MGKIVRKALFASPRIWLPPILLFLTACGGSSDSGGLRLGEGTPVEASCPGADLAGRASVIYVSPQGEDSAQCGDHPSTACRSIAQGLTRCSGNACSVLVQHGLYQTTASISLRDGVNLHGSCRFGEETDLKYRSVIRAAPTDGTAAIVGSAINTATQLTGMVVLVQDATTHGAASIALALDGSHGLTLHNMTLAPGAGANGIAGTTHGGALGDDGKEPSCTSCPGSGGLSCPTQHDPNRGNGGNGATLNQVSSRCGIIDCECGNPNFPLSLGNPGQDSGAAKGGAGGGIGSAGYICHGRPHNDPGRGGTGGIGQAGVCGAQGGARSTSLFGNASFAGLAWQGTPGGQGASGMVGAGGGGGGGGGPSTLGGSSDFHGFAGGGGGGGGCGGQGGQGGQQGGASIPLVLRNASLPAVADSNSLIPAMGGRGGDGGSGGLGGPGGKGADSPFISGTIKVIGATFSAPGLGGTGGAGGIGGAGAGGAGGNGGPSFAIALVGNAVNPGPGLGLYPGQAGAPGTGGVGGSNAQNPDSNPTPCTGARGQDGQAGGVGASFAFSPG